MKFKELLQELDKSPEFKRFKEENPDSYLTAGFFILDLQSNEKNKYQLDFFIPSKNKIAVSEFPFNQIKIEPEEITKSEKLEGEIKIDIDDLEKEIGRIMKENNTSQQTNKIIAVLKDNLWNSHELERALDKLTEMELWALETAKRYGIK